MQSASALEPDADRSVKSSEEATLRIIEAADELFCTQGFAAVSIRDIALRAGVKKASVFYHFGNKEKLFELVLARYYEAHAQALAAAGGVQGSAADRMHALLDAYLDFMEDHHRYVRLVHIELATGGPALDKIRDGLKTLYELVEDIFEGLLPTRGPLAARQFFVSFSGIVNTYALYASALGPFWQGDPLAAASRRERREHVHWVADALLAALDNENVRAQVAACHSQR